MKQITNIILLIFVLSIPFAVSQTRKAIPAGRYEALSGAKSTHTIKGADTTQNKDSMGMFWSEVSKHFPTDRKQYSYYNSGVADTGFSSLFSSKGIHESKYFDESINFFISDNLNRDNGPIKKLKVRGSLVILKDKHPLKEVMAFLNEFEVLIYESEGDSHYYLLKLK